jgi:hypothetical protein
MSNFKSEADEVRAMICALSDEELVDFRLAIWAGEKMKANPYESVTEYVKRIAKELNSSMPF